MHESQQFTHLILIYPHEKNMLVYYLSVPHSQVDYPGKGVKALRTDNKQSKVGKRNFKVILKS